LYLEGSVKKYLDDVSAKVPAPGGGSVAAASGALGCGLLLMVVNYTLGKEKYKKYEADVFMMKESLDQLKDKFSRLIDEDVAAYSSLSDAFKTKDEKNIQNALKEAAKVPMEICQSSYTALNIAEDLTKKGNTNLITDVAIGAILLDGAFYSGKLNVDINLAQIKDTDFRNRIDNSMMKLEVDLKDKKERILKTVEMILKKGD